MPVERLEDGGNAGPGRSRIANRDRADAAGCRARAGAAPQACGHTRRSESRFRGAANDRRIALTGRGPRRVRAGRAAESTSVERRTASRAARGRHATGNELGDTSGCTERSRRAERARARLNGRTDESRLGGKVARTEPARRRRWAAWRVIEPLPTYSPGSTRTHTRARAHSPGRATGGQRQFPGFFAPVEPGPGGPHAGFRPTHRGRAGVVRARARELRRGAAGRARLPARRGSVPRACRPSTTCRTPGST